MNGTTGCGTDEKGLEGILLYIGIYKFKMSRRFLYSNITNLFYPIFTFLNVNRK